MKKLILAMVLILTLTFVFVGCNKDKTEETPTTEASKVSTTEPTTKFEAPEIKDEPTTEETTEETEASAPETTTKKSTYSSNSGSSSGSSNSGSSSSNNNSKPASKPASTTKAPATTKNNSHLTDDSVTPLVTNSSGGGIFLIGDGKGDELKEEDIGSADDWEPDPEMDGWGTGADSIE